MVDLLVGILTEPPLATLFARPCVPGHGGGLQPAAGTFDEVLLQRRDAFQQDAASRQAFLAGLGVEPAAQEQLYSLFTYECASLAGWCRNT